ncbi:MAG: hypothetical protein ACLFP8_08035 [Alphaproteobacteria bacterium]
MENNLWQRAALPTLSLFTSLGTLLCCALPAFLVTLGMGATLAGLVASAPWLTVITEHKAVIFTIAGLLLLLATYMQWRARLAPCPADPVKAKACARLHAISWIMLGSSIVIYVTGFFFAFLAVHIFY